MCPSFDGHFVIKTLFGGNRNMIIMSVDFGDVRTGLAVCDKMQILASPVCVITEKDK